MAAGYGKGWVDGSCIRSKPYFTANQFNWDEVLPGKDPVPSETKTVERRHGKLIVTYHDKNHG